MLRSFQELGRVSAGFDSSHILTFRVSGNWGETTDYKALTQRIDRTLETLRATPGVLAASTSAFLPGIPSESQMEVKLTDSARTGKIMVQSRPVSNGYFATMKIPMVTGETCPVSGSAVVVNRSFVNVYLPHTNPIGQHFSGPQAGEIRGIAADAREQGLTQAPVPTVYWCVSAPFPTPYFLVRTRTDPMLLAETIRQKIHVLEPARSVYNLSPLDAHLSDDAAPTRLRTFLLTAFALSAVALACTGLYGTLSYFVSTRRRESGLRLALGATQVQIVLSFFIKGVGVAVTGCVAGVCLALTLAKALSSLLFGIRPTDLVTWSTVTATVLLVAACASLIPAVRAAMVEPMKVLREE
jgi:hypothetical protein